MTLFPQGGIKRSGTSGSYTYSLRPHMGNKPVTFVSYFDAVRFVNWLHNGQPTGEQDLGTTEDGAYFIANANAQYKRNGHARFFIPTANEWYKAAYHQPEADGGDSDDYWLYATATNDVPIIATADTTGDISNPGPNVANYDDGADWGGAFLLCLDDDDCPQNAGACDLDAMLCECAVMDPPTCIANGNVTTVGSAGPLSESYYGTRDQTGNVREWTESVAFDFYETRIIASGSWHDPEITQSSASFTSWGVDSWNSADTGFRIAAYCDPADFDCDGDVDLLDFGTFQDEFTGP
jgi:formylglycine-generating enzyme required for sulfatase activity